MVIKPFSQLARHGFTKTFVHGYAQSVVAASQSSYASTTTTLGQFHNYPVTKFAKASQLQGAFQGVPGSGAGAKAGHAPHASNANTDGGLALYYAAWQHAQQTGDDSDWKQHQFARRIGWKSSEKPSSLHQQRRLDSGHAVDLLRPVRPTIERAHSESAVQDIEKKEDTVHSDASPQSAAEASAVLSETPGEAHTAGPAPIEPEAPCASANPTSDGLLLDTPPSSGADVESTPSIPDQSSPSNDTGVTSPVVENTQTVSAHIVELGLQGRYADIPTVFQAMLQDGLVPSTDAYNAILVSAIELNKHTYQAYPKALEVYGDMTRRDILPNKLTYSILIQFLASRGKEAFDVQSSLDLRRKRYGNEDGSYIFRSSEMEHELFAGDNSVTFATKLYKKATSTFSQFTLPAETYDSLLSACTNQGLTHDISAILADMGARNIRPSAAVYVPIIQAFALAQDLSSANQCYSDYRALAVSRPVDHMDHETDMQVYAALIEAYMSCGHKDAGFRFYDKILHSYEDTANSKVLVEEMQRIFVLDASVRHYIRQTSFADALETVSRLPSSHPARGEALERICVAAVDGTNSVIAADAYKMIESSSMNAAPAMAMAAMSLREGDLSKSRPLWDHIKSMQVDNASMTDLTTMYVNSLLRQGSLEEGFEEARIMFARIRDFAPTHRKTSNAMEEIDEAILLFGETLTQTQAVVSARAAMCLLRTMIENGGLVSPVAEHAVASLGPECVHQLTHQDIALALHVQAGMLPDRLVVSDPAHAARFSHLLETVLNRNVPMDPSTVHSVSEALPKLHNSRPDLVQRWQDFLQPVSKVDLVPAVLSPIVPASPLVDASPVADNYDPYSYNTDYRASTIIAEQLESTSGRPENHLRDALGRFRNVRRAGRHPRYMTYAKLITAAGKAKQANLTHEILGMAHTDIPLRPEIPAVKAGWVSILDAMVAACLTVGDRQLAAKYHQDLLAMGAAPSANTFGIYITTLEGTFDEATEAVKIFQRAQAEGVEPGVFLYNAVIGKLGKARRIDDCLFYFGDMQSRNIRPSSVTYGTLVNALCRTSEERFAEEMFDEMEAAPNYRPRAAPYNSIIQYFLNTKRDRSKVLAYYERMKLRNIKPTSHTYKLLIEAHATLDSINLGAAEMILADMKVAGVQPEAVHYGTLIHAKGCVMHDMAGARRVFDSVLSDTMIRPTDTLYQNLFESMVANHKVGETSELLQDMATRRVSMTPYIANTLIHGWAAEGNIGKAKEIYDSVGMAKREPSTYEAMTRAFLSVEDRASAEGVVQEMLSKGYPSAVAEKVLVLVGGALS